MADLKINQMGLATTVATLLGIDTAGNLKRIEAKNIFSNNFIYRGALSGEINFDSIKTSGWYKLHGINGGYNPPGFSWGVLIVLYAEGYGLQVASSSENNILKFRTFDSGNIRNWATISAT